MKTTEKNNYEKGIAEISADFEAATSAELVIAISPNSAVYSGASWLAGSALALLALTVYIWAPIEFYDDLAYGIILACFLFGYLLVAFVPALQRLLTSKKEMLHYTDLRAHAAFAKYGVHKTKAETGLILFVSVLEQQALIVADRGVKKALSAEQLAALNKDLEGIWTGDWFANMRKVVAQHKTTFAQALPRQADDLDELGSGSTMRATPRFLHGGFGAKRFSVNKNQPSK